MARRHGWELPFHTFQVHSHSLHTTLYFQSRKAIIISCFSHGDFPPIFHLLLPFFHFLVYPFDSFPFYPAQPHLFSLWFILFFAVNSCSGFVRNLMRFVVYIVSTPFPSHFLGHSNIRLPKIFFFFFFFFSV